MGLLEKVGKSVGIEVVDGQDTEIGPATTPEEQTPPSREGSYAVEKFRTEGLRKLGVFPMVLELKSDGGYELYLMSLQPELSTEEGDKKTDFFAVIDEKGELDPKRQIQMVTTEKTVLFFFREKDEVDVIPPLGLDRNASATEWTSTRETGTITLHILKNDEALSEFLTGERGRLASNIQKFMENAAIARSEELIASA